MRLISAILQGATMGFGAVIFLVGVTIAIVLSVMHLFNGRLIDGLIVAGFTIFAIIRPHPFTFALMFIAVLVIILSAGM